MWRLSFNAAICLILFRKQTHGEHSVCRWIYCTNCSQITGFKRVWGFGTWIMLFLTFGLWLFVLPLYPARCIRCGISRGAIQTPAQRVIGFGLIAALVIIVIAIAHFSSDKPHDSGVTPVSVAPQISKSVEPAISKALFINAYVLANSGRDDFDEDQLRVLADDEYKMRVSMSGSPYLVMSMDGLFDTRGKRALQYIQDHRMLSSTQENDGASTPPHPTHTLTAAYTEEALQHQIEGVVTIRCRVSPEGNPSNCQVIHSLGYGLDENAVDALQNTGWIPAIRGGVFTDQDATESFTFRLPGSSTTPPAPIERRPPTSEASNQSQNP